MDKQTKSKIQSWCSKRAVELRNRSTAAENQIRKKLIEGGLYKHHFQKFFFSESEIYIADFYIHGIKIVIEVPMTEEQFYKYHWKAMEVVEYVHVRSNTVVQCMLLAIDFDCHTMKLVPLKDLGYEEREFWCSISMIRKIVKNQKLKVS